MSIIGSSFERLWQNIVTIFRIAAEISNRFHMRYYNDQLKTVKRNLSKACIYYICQPFESTKVYMTSYLASNKIDTIPLYRVVLEMFDIKRFRSWHRSMTLKSYMRSKTGLPFESHHGLVGLGYTWFLITTPSLRRVPFLSCLTSDFLEGFTYFDLWFMKIVAPSYLNVMVIIASPIVRAVLVRNKASSGLFDIFPSMQDRLWKSSFLDYITGPQMWNSLPSEIQNISSLNAFEKHLNTFMFNEAFPSYVTIGLLNNYTYLYDTQFGGNIAWLLMMAACTCPGIHLQ